MHMHTNTLARTRARYHSLVLSVYRFLHFSFLPFHTMLVVFLFILF